MPQAGPSGGDPGKPRAQKRVGAQKRKTIRKKAVAAVPGVGPVAKPKRVRKAQPSQVPGVSGAVSPHLAQHRENRQQRQAKKPQNQIPGVSGAVNPHLAEHRRNRATQEQGRRQARATGLPILNPNPPKPGHVAKVVASAAVNTPFDRAVKAVEGASAAAVSPVSGLTGHTVGQELAGKGLAGQALRAAGKPSEEALKGVESAIKATTGKDVSKGVQVSGLTIPPLHDIPKNVTNDAIAVPKQAVTTGYEGGKAAVELAQGKPKRAEELAKGLTEGVIGNLVKGKPAKALQYAVHHPGFAALEVAGAESAIGRTAGAAARTGALGKGAARAASIERPPLEIGPGQLKPRHGSKDIIVRAIQRRSDRKAGLKEPAEVEGMRVPGRSLKRKAAVSQRKLERERTVNIESDISQMTGRHARGEAKQEMARAKPVRKHPTPKSSKRLIKRAANKLERVRTTPEANITDLVAEGRIHPTDINQAVHDMGVMITRMRKEQPRLTGDAKRNNIQQIKHLEKASKELTPERLAAAKEASDVFVKRSRENTVAYSRKTGAPMEQLERRTLLSYATEHMGAEYKNGRFELNGRTLPTEEIKAHMRAHGRNPEDVGFVSRAPRRASTGAYQPLVRGRGGTSRKFTGESVLAGTGRSGYQALTDEAVRQQVQLSHFTAHDRLMSRITVKDEKGKPISTDHPNAERVADLYTERTGVRMVPVKLRAAQHEGDVVSELQTGHPMPNLIDEALRPPISETERKAPIWGVAPEDQMLHLKKLEGTGRGSFARIMHRANRVFVYTVLPFSSKWFAGNDIEAALRLAWRGVGPQDPVIGSRALRAMFAFDAERGQALEAGLKQRGLYGSQQRMAIHAERDVTGEPGIGESIAQQLDRLAENRAVQAAGMMVRAIPSSVMALNREIENASSLAAFGKFVRRDIQAWQGSWIKGVVAHQELLDQWVRERAFDPAKVEQALRYTDDVLGRYRRFGPKLQDLIQNYTPFLPWLLNAVKFVYWDMPVKSPFKTALLVNMEATLQDEFNKEHKAAPPGDLKSSIPLGKAEWLDVAHYTPFGAFTGEIAGLDTAAEQVLPQATGAVKAVSGLTFYNREIRGVSPQTKALLALNSLINAYVPYASTFQKIMERGHSADVTSTVFTPKGKAGSHFQSPLDRIFDPFRPVYTSGKNKAQRRSKDAHDVLGLGSKTTKDPNDVLDLGSKAKKKDPNDVLGLAP